MVPLVLVGHSLAGCSMPAPIGLLGARVRHAVFVACSVPEDGTSTRDTLPADIRAMAEAVPEGGSGVLDDCEIVDLDAAHMCMVSKPKELARILNDIAERGVDAGRR